MSHTTTTIGETEFHEAVTEAEYAAANATRAPSRVKWCGGQTEAPGVFEHCDPTIAKPHDP